MIAKMEITGVHTDLDEELKKYVYKKIGKMDRYIPRRARDSAHADVKLIEKNIKNKKECTCEVVLKLPRETIIIKESTMNMYASVDIVETKLKNQLKKYKDKHAIKRVSRQMLNKLRSR